MKLFERKSIPLLLILVLIGCAPGSKPTEEEQSSASAEIEALTNEAGAGGEAVIDRSKFAEVSSGGSVDPKYKSLAQAVRSGRSGDITSEAAKILATNSNDPIALNTLALMNLRLGKLGAAKIFINRALEKTTSSASLYNNLAIILLEEGDQPGAIQQLKKALQVNDRHTEALGNLGSIYAQGGDYARARPLLERAYRANKNNITVANNYAVTLRAAKDYAGAKRVYDDALKSNSRDVALLLNYSILLIDFMNQPKDGMDVLYRVKFLETERKDVLARVNALEKKAKSELK